MPTKNNPIEAENICSIARRVNHLAAEMWDVAANQVLERTLDDSASRRSTLPELFISIVHLVNQSSRMIEGLAVDHIAADKDIENNWKSWSTSLRLSLICRDTGVPRDAVRKILEDAARAETQEESEKALLNDPDIGEWIANHRELTFFGSFDLRIAKAETDAILQSAQGIKLVIDEHLNREDPWKQF